MIDVETNIPVMIGTLRATLSEAPRRSIVSDSTPEHNTPTNAPRKGSEARKPAFTKAMPRAWTRYVGNQVRKNHSVVVMEYWPRYSPHSFRDDSPRIRSARRKVAFGAPCRRS